jgi:hypothetical protein
MRRFTIPRKPRLAFIWGAAFTLLLAFRYEMDCRSRLRSLPALVDAQGNTASLEVAMAGLDSYGRARQIRIYGFISLGIGALLCAAAAATKSQTEGAHES